MFTVVLMVILFVFVLVVFSGKYLDSPEYSEIVISFTFIMNSTLNLMSDPYYDCERMGESFIVLLKYLRIICVFLYFVSVKLLELLLLFFNKYFSVPYVWYFVDFNVSCISACWYCFYIYESVALLIWALSIPLFQIHILHIWLIIIIF